MAHKGEDEKRAADRAKLERVHELSLENFEALGVLEAEGDLYLPTTLKTRNKTGKFDELEVLLRAPTREQQRFARLLSRELCHKQKLDPKLDEDHFKLAENHHLLWYAIRDRETRGQLEPVYSDLLARFTDQTLAECWTRLQLWIDMQDPRYGKLSGAELWRVTASIAMGGNMLPLAGMEGYEQATCIVAMAQEACLSPNAPSSLSSRSTSGQES